MEAYSEIGTIYFCIGEKTAYARETANSISCGSYIGEPPYAKTKFSRLLKQYHAAEHKTYNCFRKKISALDKNASLAELRQAIPSLEEVKETKAYSLYCGSTVLLFSGSLLVLSCLPHLFSYHNDEFLFMSLWLSSSLLAALAISYWVQNKYFLAPPKNSQIKLALEALKEVLKDDSRTNRKPKPNSSS